MKSAAAQPPHPLYIASVCSSKIVLDKIPNLCHNTPVFSLFSRL
nr:MAG TPA: Ribosome-associated protein L7Ae-like/RNA complex-protein complex, riboswitch, K-turn, L7Ae-like [Caudoviricetes sp.]